MPKSSSPSSKSRKHWEMRIAGLALDPSNNVPVVLLRDTDDNHQLPIWIGQTEAMAIASELEGVQHARPMTHDLLRNALERVGWRVTRVEICDLQENTFFARIVTTDGSREVDIDSRPSDAIALAMRTGATVLAADHVIQQARMDVPEEGPEETGLGDSAAKEGKGRAEEEAQKPSGPKPIVGPIPDSDEEWEELLRDLDANAFGKYKQ